MGSECVEREITTCVGRGDIYGEALSSVGLGGYLSHCVGKDRQIGSKRVWGKTKIHWETV